MDLCHIEIVTSEKDVPSSFESVGSICVLYVFVCVCVVCVVCVVCCVLCVVCSSIMCLRRGNSGRKGKHF